MCVCVYVDVCVCVCECVCKRVCVCVPYPLELLVAIVSISIFGYNPLLFMTVMQEIEIYFITNLCPNVHLSKWIVTI